MQTNYKNHNAVFKKKNRKEKKSETLRWMPEGDQSISMMQINLLL